MSLVRKMMMRENDEYYERMNDPTSCGAITGPCGDSMEIYLVIKDGRIETARYYTEGCENTRMCGRAVARSVEGRQVTEALGVSPAQIIESEECLPDEGRHCAILAVSTLYRAIADYLLQP